MECFETVKKQLVDRDYAILVCKMLPNESLCQEVVHLFPNLFVDWIWLVDKNDITENQHIALNMHNPYGVSFYHFSEKHQWCIFSGCLKNIPNQIISCVEDFSLDDDELKLWFRLPENKVAVKNVAIIGGGIAGATVAYALARRGVSVQLFEAQTIANAASGNRQGLLYAKISPYDTMQSRLLLRSYAYTRSLLDNLLPDKKSWSDCGVLHLDFDDNEKERNIKLGNKSTSLYRYVDANEATQLAGVDLSVGGLWWQCGAWINPSSLVHKLLDHKNIQIFEDAPIVDLNFQDGIWHLKTLEKLFSASHVVLCTGAEDSLIQNFGLDISIIGGQTDNIEATEFSGSLKIALSAEKYISPAWDNQHCFGATFHPNRKLNQTSDEDFQNNLQELKNLPTSIVKSFNEQQRLESHAATRADSFDHLPIVGSIGDNKAMQKVYAKLAFDKNYRFFKEKCPYFPQLYISTAHGSRGLCTAPLCGEAIAAEILERFHPLGDIVRSAISPNRLIIRNIVRHGRENLGYTQNA